MTGIGSQLPSMQTADKQITNTRHNASPKKKHPIQAPFRRVSNQPDQKQSWLYCRNDNKDRGPKQNHWKKTGTGMPVENDSQNSIARKNFNRVINNCAQTGDLKTAQTLLNEMEASRVQPDVVTYNALINCCAQTGDLKTAQTLLNEMKASEIQPDVVTYTTLINCCAQTGDLVSAEKLLKEMKDSGVQPDVMIYNSLIRCCTIENIDSVKKIVQEMVTAGIKPNNIFKSICLSVELIKENYCSVVKKIEGNFDSRLFTKTAGYTKNRIDFHRAAIYGDEEKLLTQRDKGIPAMVARVLVHYHHQKGNINRNTCLIVGQHGENKVKEAVLSELTQLGYQYKEDEYNPGCLVFAGYCDDGNLSSQATQQKRDSSQSKNEVLNKKVEIKSKQSNKGNNENNTCLLPSKRLDEQRQSNAKKTRRRTRVRAVKASEEKINQKALNTNSSILIDNPGHIPWFWQILNKNPMQLLFSYFNRNLN